MAEAGSRRYGAHYERVTVVDCTLWGPLTELHAVPRYQPFTLATPIAPTVDSAAAGGGGCRGR